MHKGDDDNDNNNNNNNFQQYVLEFCSVVDIERMCNTFYCFPFIETEIILNYLMCKVAATSYIIVKKGRTSA